MAAAPAMEERVTKDSQDGSESGESYADLWRRCIARVILDEREAAGMTQKEMYTQLGVSQKTMYNADKGISPNFDLYLKQCEILDLDFALVAVKARLYVRMEKIDVSTLDG